ncbi:MAG: Fe-S cluster assembly protein SufD [Candidatus Hydrogenedentota bacterium]|nr:MAG: Fe-S cluster assembly protein SufD [Candidatus Hydrogenedentota bacterium]
MAETADSIKRDHFLADLDKVKALGGSDWLQGLRANGADRFGDTAFPTYKEEAWKYTDIKPILRTPFRSLVAESASDVTKDSVSPHLYGVAGWTELVFVDGLYREDLSRLDGDDQKVHISNLASAIAAGDETVQTHLNNIAAQSSAFVPLNTAFLQDGAYVHVQANTVLESPVHFLFVSTGIEPVATYPRNLFVLGQSSQANLIETYVGLNNDTAYFSNGVTEMVLEDNAELTRHKVVMEGSESFHLGAANALMGRDTRLKSFTFSFGGKIIRNELNVVLNGEGGQCDLNGLYLNSEDRLIDNALFVKHASPKCYSRMAYKGVLDGTSRSVFTGMVLVPQDSQRTDSDQLNNNLLLSDKATIDTKPQLEIFADDVKCTHGATIGGFPKELIFYFQSRGMSAAMANAMLTYGFAAEIVDSVECEPLHDRLADYVFSKFRPKQA